MSYPIPENASYINPPGSNVAKFASLNVHKRLVTEEAYKNDDYEVALKKAFLGTDEDILAGQSIFSSLSFLTDVYLDPELAKDHSGCTAVAALLSHDNKIYVVCPCPPTVSLVMTNNIKANASDSRCVLGVKGQVKSLSFDHKPTNDGELRHFTSAQITYLLTPIYIHS